MILKQLTLNNILTYAGEQTINFPESRQSSLTILVGPNSAGKTSIIRALKFFLYGEKGLPPDQNVQAYIGKRLLAATPVEQTAKAWVEVVIRHRFNNETSEMRLRRQIEVKRLAEDSWHKQPTVTLFEVQYAGQGRPPRLVPDDQGARQRTLTRLVPEALFDAFYFRGEPLDGKLLGDLNNIRGALGVFLHEDEWKQAEMAAREIRGRIDKEIQKLTANQTELRDAVQKCRDAEDRVDVLDKALNEQIIPRASLEQERSNFELAWKAVGNHDVSAAQSEISKAERAKAEADARIRECDAELHRMIGKSMGLPFLLGGVDGVASILSSMQQQNILPADITEGFVDRVLANDACVCGRVHDTGSRENWEAYREKSMAAEASNGLRKLLDWVSPSGPWSITQSARNSQEQLDRLLTERKKAVEASNRAATWLAEATAKFKEIPIDEIQQLARRRNQIVSDIANLEKNIGITSRKLQEEKAGLAALQKNVEAAKKKAGGTSKEFDKLEATKKRARDLEELLVRCRRELTEHFRAALQKSLSESYDRHATDGSRAIIDAQTLRPSITASGQRTNLLGGGQSQLMALSYVVALARLRQQMHQWMDQLGAKLGQIDDLSFFMDSPLGHMEDHYKKAATALIPGSARQVLLLLWKEEWDYVREKISQHADSIYAVRLNTREEDVRKVAEADRLYTFPDRTVELIVPLPAQEQQPHSEFIQIK
jgi:DNA sulfur modification protein DndD